MMNQNETEFEISRQQELAIEHIAAGVSVTRTAEELGIARSTIHRWLRADYAFQANLNALRSRLRDSAELRLVCLVDSAIDTVAAAIGDGDVRSALMLLKGVGLLSGEAGIIGGDDAAMLQREAGVSIRERSSELARRELFATFPG